MTVDVPYLSKAVIEAEADLLLAEFARAHYEVVAPPVPIDEIVELHLKLAFEIIDLRTLFGHGDIHGAIWINQKRIAVDARLDPTNHPAKRGRYHYTLAHETGHWRLHRKHFLRRKDAPTLFGDDHPKPDCVCRSSEKKKPIEWQADFFAAQLLMPRAMVKDAWEQWRGEPGPVTLDDLGDRKGTLLAAEILKRGSAKTGPDAEADMILEQLSRPLAEQFQVSPEAMRIRLEALGYLARTKEASLFE
jgi:Zn-dependent peptidase ImmA (M78 family)